MSIHNKFFAVLLSFLFMIAITGCSDEPRVHKSWIEAPAAPTYSDYDIRARILTATGTDPDLQGFKIDAKIDDGLVTLTGVVSTQDHINRVTMYTWMVDGVKDVDNQITLK